MKSAGQLEFRLEADQGNRPLSPDLRDAIERLSEAASGKEQGAVFTRPEVVDFILDLVGYTADRPLQNFRVLEPAVGQGDFLLPMVSRLLKAYQSTKTRGDVVEDLGDAIAGVELHRASCKQTRTRVRELLHEAGLPEKAAAALSDRWLIQDDFLLSRARGEFDFVVGNPPYVRPELIPPTLLAEYRARFKTMSDRADLYIPFIERSLSVLSAGGQLGFICADRWTKNRYGARLRAKVAETFHLKFYVDMTGTSAFRSDVVAYPAITVISREPAKPTRVARCETIDRKSLQKLAKQLTSKASPVPRAAHRLREQVDVAKGGEPWLFNSPEQTDLIRRLEDRFPTLETASCKVGIGVATGADKVFIADYAELDVEPDRKLRLATTRDIKTGEVSWYGQGVINPFANDGRLVDLDEYPLLRAYLNAQKQKLVRRHCARKNPGNWYRTIDRITPSLASRPKLLIPDIKGEANIVFEGGTLYPHHNLYYIVSSEWDLRALQAVLLSSVARLFVANYSTKMRGGYLRFQAQYLRRIRIPLWSDTPVDLRNELSQAGEDRDRAACDHAAFKLYKLTPAEQTVLGEIDS